MKRTRMIKSIAVALMFVVAFAFTITVPASATSTGGWSVSKAKYSFLTKSQKKVFTKATKGMAGVSYKPVALLAKQTVAGTNYVYLCQGKTVTAKPRKSWYILTANKALNNKVSLLSTEKMKVSSIKTNKKPRTSDLDGGLEIVKIKNKSAALSKSARKVFKQGTKKYKKYDLRPIALLGTQIVAGKNYRFLCYGTGSKKVKDIFVVDIYKNLNGKCSVKSCKALNLEEYVDPGVGERRY